jgi:carboxyl-terminal processing protease
MPRRNIFLLAAVALVALLCYERVQKTPYGRVLANAMNTIESQYFEPVKESTLFENAMRGMIHELDPNSAYFSPEQIKHFRESIDLQFEGVGMEVAIDPETKRLTVLSPLAGSPAYAAGVLAGDAILRIDDNSTQGMSLHDAVGLLRGRPGTSVTLTVLHKGQEKPVDVTIARGKIQAESVRGDTRNADGSWNFLLEGHNRIGYIRIDSFIENTPVEMDNALTWLSKNKMQGLILDLRDDPGGYLGAAIQVCDELLPSGTIVSVRRRGGQISETYSATGDGRFTHFPIAVLINGNTASAAEIVAACLQDNHRASIFGQRSFGKGTVQEVIDLEKGCGAMKITTASYWRPNGKNIHRDKDAGPNSEWGVLPDKRGTVELSDDQQNQWRQWRARRDGLPSPNKNDTAQNGQKPFVDQVLLKAVKYIQQEATGQ